MKIALLSVLCFCSVSVSLADNETAVMPVSALDLMKLLKKVPVAYTVNEESRVSYVKKSDLPHLYKMIDSKEVCAHVVLSSSSHLVSINSSVGDEAAYLIDSYLKGFYPSKLSSDRDKPNKEKLKQWYEKYVAIKKTTK